MSVPVWLPRYAMTAQRRRLLSSAMRRAVACKEISVSLESGQQPPSQPGLPSPAQVRAALTAALGVPANASALRQTLRHGGLVLSFTAPSGGRLTVGWYLVAKGAHLAAKAKPVLVASLSAVAQKAGRVKVKQVLTGAGRRMLSEKGSLHLTAKATFTPSGGTATTVTKPQTV